MFKRRRFKQVRADHAVLWVSGETGEFGSD